ncbi:hypothetical protein ACFVJK_28290 [Streptomyces sp. NPDC127172]|uniref:hypothetical protein n=1 Tax=Streptomyces sp. NPDC127172 TaxID=3345382 RepID=UPI003642F7E4
MSTPTDLATLAASALVGSMTTDVWTYARRRLGALLARHAPDEREQLLTRLDTYQSAVAVVVPEQREAITGSFGRLVAEALRDVVGRSAEVADEVRSLVDDLKSRPEATVVNSNLTFRNIKASRDFIWSGHDTHVSREEQ